MKNIFGNLKSRILILSCISCIMVVASSCSKKIAFQNSTIVPAARGTVQIKSDKNNNYDISIALSDLAEVDRLTPPKQTYIVWMLTDERITKNIGQLNSSKSGLSNKLKASFNTVSAFKPIKIFITAEDASDATYPSQMVVLSADM
jgi:hypothetical protein